MAGNKHLSSGSVRTIAAHKIDRDTSGKPHIKPAQPQKQHIKKTQAQYPTRAVQPKPRWDRVTKVMAFDGEWQNEEEIATKTRRSRPGRVSVTNSKGEVVYDTFVYFPRKRGVRYWCHARRKGLGCYKQDVKPNHGARPIAEVERNLRKLFKGAIMVGHSIHNDFQVFEGHVFDGVDYRDTQKADEYRKHANPRSQYGPSLKTLAIEVLGYSIQGDEHSSVEDAQATMKLYQLREHSIEQNQWSQTYYGVGTYEEVNAKYAARQAEYNARQKEINDAYFRANLEAYTKQFDAWVAATTPSPNADVQLSIASSRSTTPTTIAPTMPIAPTTLAATDKPAAKIIESTTKPTTAVPAKQTNTVPIILAPTAASYADAKARANVLIACPVITF